MAYIKLKDPTSFIIKKQVVRVEKLVGQKNKFKEVAFKKKIKLTESLRREETEESLEKYEDRGKKIKGFSTPRLGFLDSIKNFLFSVLFGSLALKLLPYLPQLKGLLITTLKVGNFAVEFAGTILNAMVTFVDKVYGIIDFGKQQAKILGGDSGVKNYENMLGMTSKVMNYVLIAGMLFSDLIVIKAQADSNQSAVGDIGKEVTEEIVKRQGFRQAIQGFATKIASTVAAKILIVGLASSLLGELSFQQRKFTKKLENDVAYQLKEAKSDPNPITRALKLVAYNAALPGLRFFNFVSTGVGTLLDIIGAPFRYAVELLNLGIMSLTGDSDGIKRQRENLGKLDARIREQIREVVNTLSLGTLAKEKGSFGSLYGSSATTAMGYASGGAVTREGQEAIGGVITRTGGKKAISRTFEIPMSPLNPGAGIGGQMNYIDPDTKKPTKSSNIETFFPNPKDSQYINSYEYLTGSYNIVSSGEFLKPFLQMPIKMIMGNGSSEGDYNSLASSVNNLFVTILRRTLVPGTKKSLADELGFVDIFSWARDSIRKSMIDPVNTLLQSLKEQFMLKSGAGPGLVKGAADGSGGASGEGDPSGGSGGASYGTPEMKALLDVLAHAEGTTNNRNGATGPAGYSTWAGFQIHGPTDLTNQTIQQVHDLQTSFLKAGKQRVTGSAVVGRYQFKGLLNFAKQAGLNPDVDKFSPTNQDKMAIKEIERVGVNSKILKSEGLTTRSLDKLAPVWASLPYSPKGGKSYYGQSYKNPDDLIALYKKQLGIKQTEMATDFNSNSGELRNRSSGTDKNVQSISHPDTGSGYTIAGVKDEQGRPAVFSQKAASAFGIMMSDSKGVVKGSDIASSQRNVAKNASLPGAAKNSNHLYGNALDIHGSSQTWMRANGKKYGWNINDYRGSHGGHFDFKGYKEGGPVNKTDYALTHPGEYVVDADSVKLFGIQFYDIINKVEMVSQRKNASDSLISILSQYTEDGFPETEDDYSYQVSPPQVIMIPGPVIEIESSSGSSSGGSGGDDDTSQDHTELH
jgi:muramidase (phage lysozyme)